VVVATSGMATTPLDGAWRQRCWLAHLALDPSQHRGHAAQPERAHHVVEPQLADELARCGQDIIGIEPIKGRVEDAGKAAGGRRLRRGIEEQVNRATVVHLDGQEQRRLAFGHPLQQVAVPGVAGGQGWQFLGELQQQLQPFVARDRTEVLDDLPQARVERAGRHGFSPRVIGTRTLFPHSVHDPS
jgi:hypothetical protein